MLHGINKIRNSRGSELDMRKLTTTSPAVIIPTFPKNCSSPVQAQSQSRPTSWRLTPRGWRLSEFGASKRDNWNSVLQAARSLARTTTTANSHSATSSAEQARGVACEATFLSPSISLLGAVYLHPPEFLRPFTLFRALCVTVPASPLAAASLLRWPDYLSNCSGISPLAPQCRCIPSTSLLVPTSSDHQIALPLRIA